MISKEVRIALVSLMEQLLSVSNPEGPFVDNAGDCMAELLCEVIDIARQNAMAECLKSAPKRRFFTKDEIIIRAFRGLDFDLEDMGLKLPE